MIYDMDDFVLANLCLYAYETPDTLKNHVFGSGLMFGGAVWTFNESNFIENTTTDTQCYLFASRSSNDIALVFRGTESTWQDWISDAKNLSYTAWPSDQANSKVGSGWLTCWNSVKKEVENRLSALLPSSGNVNVYISGHSMGASIASVAAVDLWRDVLSKRLPNPSVKVVTFATPLAGNQTFVNYFQTLSSKFGSYLMYRDPNDKISWVNAFLSSSVFSDPYVDFSNVSSTRPADGHFMFNYVNLLNPGTVEYQIPDSNSSIHLLSPDDPISAISLNVVVSHSFVVDTMVPPPPIDVSLFAGVNPDGTGGVELPLYRSNGKLPYFSPGNLNFYTFDPQLFQNMHISDLKRCKLVYTMACDVDQDCSNINFNNPILLDGLQLIVNGFPMMTDYALGINISNVNESFMLKVPTPHYNIVGGRMQVTNSTSKEPWIETIFWGERSAKEVYWMNARCFSTQYGVDSYCYTSVYVEPTGEKPTNTQVVIGGRMQVTNDTSSKPFIETIFWGQRSASEQIISSNRGYSTQYDNGYSYTSFYLSPSGEAPTSLPRVIGGRMLVTNGTSKMPFIETTFWGERSNYETYISNGNCYSIPYGSESYGYMTVYTDQPLNTEYVIITLEVNLLSVYCELTQENGMFGNHDEIYLKKNGSKVWPAQDPYYSIKMGQLVNINRTFQVNQQTSVTWELWEKDDFSADDQLYEYVFSNDMLAYDPETDQYVTLQNCQPNKTYRIWGQRVDGDNYAYYLNVQVSS